MKSLLALAALFAVPASAATLPSPNWPAPADRGPLLLRATTISLHNAARREFGVAPLQWSDDLAAGAMAHANYMARTGIYGHDKTPGRRKVAGENLWRGTRGVFSYDTMIQVMVDEQKLFRAGLFPDNSSNGRWEAVAHYTQIIWPTTTHVGCGLASSATTDYFVCRYSPAGNKEGFQLVAGRDPLVSAEVSAGAAQIATRRD